MTLAAGAATMLRPLSARSIIASTLLGSHPPTMPGWLLVALGERFGIASGTARVALSRMVEQGELTNCDGNYSLAGPLVERQQRQDLGRAPVIDTWDGTWEQSVVVATGEPANRRSQLRRHLTTLRLGELRDGVWMRPANLDALRSTSTRTAIDGQVRSFRVRQVLEVDGPSLAGDLFDLRSWTETANSLAESLNAATGRLGTDDDALVDGFMLSAAAVRHFTHDPLLPAELEPSTWPAARLRESYGSFQADYGEVLATFFRSQVSPGSSG